MKTRTYQIVVVPTYQIIRSTLTDDTGSIETIATVDNELVADMIIESMKEDDMRDGYFVKSKITKY